MLDSTFQGNYECVNNTYTTAQLKKSILNIIDKYNYQYYSLYQENPYPLTKRKSYFINCFDENFNIDKDSHKTILNSFNIMPSATFPFFISWHEKMNNHYPEIWRDFNSRENILAHSIIHKTQKGEKTLCSFFRVKSHQYLKENIEYTQKLFSLSELIANKLSLLVTDDTCIPSLTMREIEIMRWASEGKTSADIGSILTLSTRTVNFHIANILDKLAVPNKVAAIAKAICYNLI
ncbi:MAG: LuxR C-terminal-related transcriptional regulator [Enterobacteriaceae bacterium]|jgi:LuxR family transcriptional regulator|nr:LuxR C-terminal-related transcriptional regulator [Enterobacteriaceae bacterium]